MVGTGLSIFFHYDLGDIRDSMIPAENEEEIRREKLFDYLGRQSKEIGRNDDFFIYIQPLSDFNGIINLWGEGSLRDEAVGHILSSDRMRSPRIVSCSNKNYDYIERILRKERGDLSCLSRGVFGWVFNQRAIKYNNS